MKKIFIEFLDKLISLLKELKDKLSNLPENKKSIKKETISEKTNIKNKGKITKHFTWEEFERSNYAINNKINNTIPEIHKKNVIRLCQNILEPIREYYNSPIIITSGYRNKNVNTGVGGSLNSLHLYGLAADFKVNGITDRQLMNDLIDGKIPIKEKYHEIIFYNDGRIHLGISDYPEGKAKDARYGYGQYKRNR